MTEFQKFNINATLRSANQSSFFLLGVIAIVSLLNYNYYIF